MVGEVSRRWLLHRIDERCHRAVDDLLVTIAEHIGVATADAVSIRVLGDDGTTLHSVVAHHPVAARAEAMAAAMGTAQLADVGLWRPIIESAEPRRYAIQPGTVPCEASEPQRLFFATHPVRGVLGAPVLSAGRVVGGVAVVRFGVDEPFTDDDEALLVEAAKRIAPALELRKLIDGTEAW